MKNRSEIPLLLRAVGQLDIACRVPRYISRYRHFGYSHPAWTWLATALRFRFPWKSPGQEGVPRRHLRQNPECLAGLLCACRTWCLDGRCRPPFGIRDFERRLVFLEQLIESNDRVDLITVLRAPES